MPLASAADTLDINIHVAGQENDRRDCMTVVAGEMA